MKNIFVILAVACLCMPIASASVRDVNVSIPSIAPNEEFSFLIEIDGDLPTVVGVALKIPEGFELVNCSKPYKVSGKNVSLAVINDTKAECKFKAPLSEGKFIFEGRWVDMLNKGEGKLKTSVFVRSSPTTTPTITTTATTPTPTTVTVTPTTTNISTETSKQTPGFEFAMAILSLIILWRWLR